MSVSAAHADAFYSEVVRDGAVWAIEDEGGFPAPEVNGVRTMPFWSSRSRAEKVTESVTAYQGFRPVALPLAEWRSRWLPGLRKDGCLVGLNWSGPRATGYDISPEDV